VGYSVQEKAECVGTFRWIEIQLMEMLARWVPTTPEMEIKILFGRHVWDCAQHADALGKRAFELRAPLHYTLPAIQAYSALLHDIADLPQTADRVYACYSIICPGIVERYRGYIGNTDPLMDEPTVRILGSVLLDYDRMFAERDRLAGDTLQLKPPVILPEWRGREQAIGNVIVHGENNKRARGIRA